MSLALRSRKLSGNEFQTDGPATEKVRQSNIPSRYTTVRQEVDDWRITDHAVMM